MVVNEGESTTSHVFFVKTGSFTCRRRIAAEPEAASESEDDITVDVVNTERVRPPTATTANAFTASMLSQTNLTRPMTAGTLGSAFQTSPLQNRVRRTTSFGGDSSTYIHSQARMHTPQQPSHARTLSDRLKEPGISERTSLLVDTGRLLQDAMFCEGDVATDTVCADMHGCAVYMVWKDVLQVLSASKSTSTTVQPWDKDASALGDKRHPISDITADKAVLQQFASARLGRLVNAPLRDPSESATTSVACAPSSRPSTAAARSVKSGRSSKDSDIFSKPLSRAGRSPRGTFVYKLPNIEMRGSNNSSSSSIFDIEAAALALLDASTTIAPQPPPSPPADPVATPIRPPRAQRPSTGARPPSSAGRRVWEPASPVVTPKSPAFHATSSRRPVSAAGFNWRRGAHDRRAVVTPSWALETQQEQHTSSVFVTQAPMLW